MRLFRQHALPPPPGRHQPAAARRPQRARRLAVPAGALALTVALLAGGAHGLMLAYPPAPSDGANPAAPEVLSPLQPWLPGASLVVPEPSGLWAEERQGTQLLLARARPDGPAQRVSLCARAQPASEGRQTLYPMVLTAGWNSPTAPHRGAGRPMVLPEALAPGLPQLVVQGQLPPQASQPAALQLQVRPASTHSLGSWQVSLARPLPGTASAGTSRFALGQEAWLLWSAPQHSAADAGEPGLVQGVLPHAHGVRLRRTAVAGCAWGGLEWQLFDARPVQGEPLTSQLSVQPASADALDHPLRLAVPAGRHTVPGQAPAPMEDSALFTQALAAGLVRGLPDGRVAVAPSDAAPHPLLKALYRSANGAHVRAQIRLANQDRYWLALRLRAADGGGLPVSGEPARWHVSAPGELLGWQAGLPPVAARLQAGPAEGFTDWVRVQAPAGWAMPQLDPQDPNAAALMQPVQPVQSVQLELPVQSPTGSRLQLMVLGRVDAVHGAQVLADQPACDGPGCSSPDMLRRLTLALEPGATALRLTLRDQPAFNRLNPAQAAQHRVQWRREQWAWVEPALGASPTAEPAEVTLLARDGQPLFTQGQATPLARDSGLLPLVGVDPRHGRSLAGSLARLGGRGLPQVQAQTTLDPAYQASLQAVLACQGAQAGRWLPAEGRCQADPQAPPVPAERISAAVLLDAEQGELLALASGQAVPAGLAASELLAFDAFNPMHSPLRLPALQHSGGRTQTVGSTFKLLDALMLEDLAASLPGLEGMLQGQTPGALEARARAAGLSFDLGSACYPAPCDGRSTQVTNHKRATAARYLEDGRFGLVQALRHSVNTWFAMGAELTDRTAGSGREEARPLGQDGLRRERPMLSLVDRLGFAQAQRLDAGLLPADLPLHGGDALLASASAFDPIDDAHNIRMQALGLRMQSTPLQMARVAGAIATGRVPPVHLLARLNGQDATPLAGTPLTMRLDRVRLGMQEVVRAGTAAGAFSAPALKAVRPLVYGKTGTAPLGDTQACQGTDDEHTATGQCLNNAWFVGYLRPGALPGEPRTLAFAVQVSHTRQTGGAAAAAVVAAWLQDRWARAPAAARTGATGTSGASR